MKTPSREEIDEHVAKCRYESHKAWAEYNCKTNEELEEFIRLTKEDLEKGYPTVYHYVEYAGRVEFVQNLDKILEERKSGSTNT